MNHAPTFVYPLFTQIIPNVHKIPILCLPEIPLWLSKVNGGKGRYTQVFRRKVAVLCLELLGLACMLYAILELARYIIVYHQQHPDFYLTWGLYIELSCLALALVYWAIVFGRTLRRFAAALDDRGMQKPSRRARS